MKSLYIRCAALLLATALLLTSCGATPEAFSAALLPAEKTEMHQWIPVKGKEPVTVTHGVWQMVLSPEDGSFTVTNTVTSAVWHSNPPGGAETSGVTGLGKLQLNSQLLISVYGEGSSNETLFASSNASVKKGGLTVSVDGSSIRCVYHFKNEGITVPVEYTLNDHGLEAAVITGEVEESGEKLLAGVSLLPYFASVASNKAGWLLVPDGSGALLELTDGVDAYGSLIYKKYVYGMDPLLSLKQVTTKSEEILIPAFGSQSAGRGVLGLVTAGESVTTLQINGEGNNSGFSSIFPSVVYRESDTLTLYKNSGNELTTFAYEQTPISLSAWRVQYFFCEDTDYNIMAQTVAEYYKQQWKLTSRTDSSGRLYLYALGAVEQKTHVLGMPIDKATAVTTYAQASSWLDTLQQEGVDSVTLLYDGIFKGGVQNVYHLSAQRESVLGSSADWQSLLDRATDGVSVVPVVDLQRIYRSGSGVSKKNSAARGVKASFLELYRLQYSTGTPLKTAPSYTLLSPTLLPSVYARFTDALRKSGSTAVCDAGLSALSADYRRNSEQGSDPFRVDRQQALAYQRQALDTSLDGLNWYTQTAYAYMLPYLQGIAALPVKSSRYNGMQDVPFVQLVFGRFTEYAMPVVNSYPNHDAYLLKMLEYGALPSLSAMDAQRTDISSTDVEITAGTFSEWKDIAVTMGRTAKDVYGALSGVMVGHRLCADGVYCSEYSGGGAIYVNYTEADVTVDGVTVPAGSYYVHGG